MAACRALGYRESELVGQDAAILHTDYGRFLRFGQSGQTFGEVGEPFSSCGWVKRRDGGILSSEHLVTPVATSDDSGIHLSFLKLDDCPEWVALYHKMRSLTAREEEILRHTLRGQGAKTIAIELDISYRTVESHRANLLRKLGVRTTTALFSLFTRPELRH
ncbi:helix-turn-helix transcriptional regulator [Marivibrio halodurans]|uniref:Helix-turn-helix transcriptional regulator n=1 Tax=Marivibrio halodurans TaxID=2039722 RepID=A0A8J7S1C9_9PROT|nr:helix-turn-helix transcriptional regulator [Marivibrio halodurans]MBP5858085.1 helix-turn-helix transcriptional regulator [Marivibrio halodurans]